MAGSTANTTRCVWSRSSIPTRRTVRIIRRRGSTPGRPIDTPRCIDFPRPDGANRMDEVRMEDVATTILSERHCHLGEGPTYDPATNTAWWFDILERMLFQADLASGDVTSYALPAMASVLAVVDDKSQLLATENGLYVRSIVDGRLTLHTPLESDNAATRSNDGRTHPCGALWVG